MKNINKLDLLSEIMRNNSQELSPSELQEILAKYGLKVQSDEPLSENEKQFNDVSLKSEAEELGFIHEEDDYHDKLARDVLGGEGSAGDFDGAIEGSHSFGTRVDKIGVPSHSPYHGPSEDELINSGIIRDRNYAEVITGKTTYSDYLKIRPGVLRRQRIKMLSNRLIPWKGGSIIDLKFLDLLPQILGRDDIPGVSYLRRFDKDYICRALEIIDYLDYSDCHIDKSVFNKLMWFLYKSNKSPKEVFSTLLVQFLSEEFIATPTIDVRFTRKVDHKVRVGDVNYNSFNNHSVIMKFNELLESVSANFLYTVQTPEFWDWLRGIKEEISSFFSMPQDKLIIEFFNPNHKIDNFKVNLQRYIIRAYNTLNLERGEYNRKAYTSPTRACISIARFLERNKQNYASTSFYYHFVNITKPDYYAYGFEHFEGQLSRFIEYANEWLYSSL